MKTRKDVHFFAIFLKIRLEVLSRTSVVGNIEKASEGRNLGKMSAGSFEIANYLICDAPYSTGRDEEEEDTFSCLKSPETSGGCWYRSVPLWHQAANLVSKPLWVC